MKILSHRGLWYKEEEKNQPVAFSRSFDKQFGTETDIRDLNGELVVSHDPPVSGVLSAEDFFGIYQKFNQKFTLALNIKSDGLQERLLELLKKYEIENYFVFDMSIPDSLGYLKNDINMYSRQSEYEPVPAFYEKVKGIWIDCFEGDWSDLDTIKEHLSNNKHICFVSPDLHKRDHQLFWNWIRGNQLDGNEKISLCTDFPELALEFFDGKN